MAPPEGQNDMDSGRRVDDEAAVRRLLGSWMSRSGSDDIPADDPGPGTGLGVPPAPAGEVNAAARRVAGRGRRGDPEPVPELRLIAEAMVLDEHPSARDWTDTEKREALDGITLIIHRFGEDGVQRLIAELNAP
jgi:hypothetical protein